MRRLAGWGVLLRPGGCKPHKDTGGQPGLQWILNEQENKCILKGQGRELWKDMSSPRCLLEVDSTPLK